MIFKTRQLLVLVIVFLFLRCSDDDSSGNNPTLTLNTTLSIFGGSLNDSAQSIVSTNDGGYIILGYTQSNNGDITDKQDTSFDYWVLKFNAQNEFQWNKTFGGSGDDRGQTIIQTRDDGYAILGTSSSNDGDVSGNSGAQDYWLIKLDSSGTLLWQKSFGFSGADMGISLIETNDQGFLLTGVLDVTASGGLGNTSTTNDSKQEALNTQALSAQHAGGDYWAIKTDSGGNLEWSQYYGGNFTDTPEGVVQTEDGGFIIAGGSDSADTDINNNLGTYDFWVVKISNHGELLWERSFGGDAIDEARAVVSAEDGNDVIAGDTRSQSNNVSSNNGAADLWLVKITPQGDFIWG